MIFSWDPPKLPGVYPSQRVFYNFHPRTKSAPDFYRSNEWSVGLPMPTRGVSIPIYCLSCAKCASEWVSSTIYLHIIRNIFNVTHSAPNISTKVFLEVFSIRTPCRFFGLSILRPGPKLWRLSIVGIRSVRSGFMQCSRLPPSLALPSFFPSFCESHKSEFLHSGIA